MAVFGGTIRDESGVVVPYAKITLIENLKGLGRESEFDRNGAFQFPAIAAGIYFLARGETGLQGRADARLEN